MAVAGIVCKTRLLFSIEIKNILCKPGIINNNVKYHSAHFRKWRQCRKFTTSVVLSDKQKDHEVHEQSQQRPQHPSPAHEIESEYSVTLTNSYFNGDQGCGEMNVAVAYYRGLPQITVPLPSRKERCRFTLRPISNTVGDFLDMLRNEDRGIDRTAVLSPQGTRIAASDTIEALFEDDFNLIINDKCYYVKTPKQERLTSEEIHRLSDVRNLVNQLYEALNVQEHQLHKERELCTKLEHLKQELQPLEETRQVLESQAQRRGNVLAWAGLGLMSVQFGILARLTWWEYSWDIMEPVTYFVTYGTAMAAYAYFVLTKEEYLLPDVKDRQHLFTLHKKAKKVGLDITKYNSLKDQISAIEYDLNRLRDPLHIHLPQNKLPNKKQSCFKTLIKDNANKFFERKFKA